MSTAAGRSASSDGPRPRPRPTEATAAGATGGPRAAEPPRASRGSGRRGRGRRPGAQVARVEAQGAQLATTAGSAVVTAARVGRLLGRTGWRLARQLPGVDVVEAQAQKLRGAAAAELLRMLELPQQVFGGGTPEEQRAVLLAQQGADDPEPLRSAMTELLERAGDRSRTRSRDYLFGTIVSQLVPDEARILAVLADHSPYAVVDVVAKQIGRSATRTVLANASTVGAVAGIVSPADTATHLSRLHTLGLVDIGQPEGDVDQLAGQYDTLEDDTAVRDAKVEVDSAKLGNAKIVRKTVQLSALGRDFWAACAPSRTAGAAQQRR